MTVSPSSLSAEFESGGRGDAFRCVVIGPLPSVPDGHPPHPYRPSRSPHPEAPAAGRLGQRRQQCSGRRLPCRDGRGHGRGGTATRVSAQSGEAPSVGDVMRDADDAASPIVTFSPPRALRDHSLRAGASRRRRRSAGRPDTACDADGRLVAVAAVEVDDCLDVMHRGGGASRLGASLRAAGLAHGERRVSAACRGMPPVYARRKVSHCGGERVGAAPPRGPAVRPPFVPFLRVPLAASGCCRPECAALNPAGRGVGTGATWWWWARGGRGDGRCGHPGGELPSH